MATPVVQVADRKTFNQASTVTTWTAFAGPTNIAANDIIFAVVGMNGNGNVGLSGMGLTWTELVDIAGGGNALHIAIYWARAAGGETGNITITSSLANGGGVVVDRITGVDPSTAPVAATATGDSTNPNPPTLNPAGWATPEETLWAACAANDNGALAITAGPSGYSNFVNERWNNSNGAGMAVAYIGTTADSEDPGTFTMATEQWAAATVAFRPAAGGGTTYERTAAIAATAAVTVANREFLSVLERSAAIAATAAVTVAHQRDQLRSSSIAATGAITATGQFFTTLERAASLAATAAITAAGEASTPATTHERSATLAATTAITAGHQRDHLRAAAVTATAAITAAGEFWSTLERTATLAATTAIAAAPQRDLNRSAALTATATITATGEQDGVVTGSVTLAATASITTGHQRDHQRTASLAATATVTVSGGAQGVTERAATLAATATITAAGIVNTTLERAAAFAATGALTATGVSFGPIETPATITLVYAEPHRHVTYAEPLHVTYAHAGHIRHTEHAALTHKEN